MKQAVAPSALKFLASSIWHRRNAFIVAFLLALLTSIAGIALLGVSGWFIVSAALAGTSGAFQVFVPSALVRGFSFIRIASRYAERVKGHAATLRIQADLRVSIFNSLIPRIPDATKGVRAGEFASALVNDINALDIVVLQSAIPAAVAFVVGASMSLIIGTLSLEVGVALFAITTTSIWLIPYVLRKSSVNIGKMAQYWQSELQSEVVESVQAHADIIALGAKDSVILRVNKASRSWVAAALRQDTAAIIGQFALQVISGSITVLVLWWGLDAIYRQQVSGAFVTALLLATVGLFESFLPLTRGAAKLGTANAAAENLWRSVSSKVTVEDPDYPVGLPQGSSVVFDNISFAYDTHPDDYIFKNFSLSISEGERVAIVGESGCGKTTLLHLILKLHKLNAGTVKVADTDVSCVDVGDLYKRITLMSQEAPVFSGTIKENLLLGRPHATESMLWNALEDAQLYAWVRQLNNGLDSYLGELGSTISAGQARRLCLARALLRESSILLLDEPTAGLDVQAQEAFFNALKTTTVNRTVVMATHATIPKSIFDRVVHID